MWGWEEQAREEESPERGWEEPAREEARQVRG